jgi:hypothetical protein
MLCMRSNISTFLHYCVCGLDFRLGILLVSRDVFLLSFMAVSCFTPAKWHLYRPSDVTDSVEQTISSERPSLLGDMKARKPLTVEQC